jgi:hypothetical protein
MGSQAKKDALGLWEAEEPLETIQLAMRLEHGTSRMTVKKWVLRWNRKRERKGKLPSRPIV